MTSMHPRRCAAPMLRLALATMCVTACHADPELAHLSAPVVYGADDRQDYFEASDPAFAERLRSAAVALVDPDYIDLSNPDDVVPDTTTLGEYQNLCPGERFAHQPAMASCSGTLIDDDLVLTAAHCVDAAVCAKWYFVLGFYMTSADQLNRMTSADVHTCAEIVLSEYTEDAREDTWHDYAIVRLDRPVDSRYRPAPIAMDPGALEAGHTLTAIGFGNGIPAKIHGGGVVRRSTVSWGYFTGSTDTFAGNSGSGTYNAAHELVGVFVRGGDEDYVPGRGGCSVVNTLPENKATQEYDYAAKAITALCARGYPSARLCGGDEPNPPEPSPPDPSPPDPTDPGTEDPADPEPGETFGGCHLTTGPSIGVAVTLLGWGAARRRRSRR